MKRIIVLGTGTGVGKTYATAALARALRVELCGHAVAALKPVETGVADADADALALARASAGVALPEPHPLFAFPAPLSPHLASRLVNAPPITATAVTSWLDSWQHDMPPHVMSRIVLLLETAGGVFSPLAPGLTNFDLANALGPALWLLIAPDSLGVLHDLSATLAACRARGRSPDLVALSEARPPDASTGTNAAELEALGIATPAAVLRRDDPASARALARAVIERLR